MGQPATSAPACLASLTLLPPLRVPTSSLHGATNVQLNEPLVQLGSNEGGCRSCLPETQSKQETRSSMHSADWKAQRVIAQMTELGCSDRGEARIPVHKVVETSPGRPAGTGKEERPCPAEQRLGWSLSLFAPYFKRDWFLQSKNNPGWPPR